MSSNDLTLDLCSTANYLALNMLYAKRFIPPGESIEESDIREFSPGHWGCVPGLNFIWANLVSHATTSTRIAPIVGTGHGGASWAAWLLLNTADLAGHLSRPDLDEIISGFGDEERTPHELFGPMPGVWWPTGELGYALGIGQGAAAQIADRVAVIVGDGELETGCTLSALAAGAILPRPPLVVINANGFRMGGLSWFAQLPAHGRDFLASLGWDHCLVDEGNVDSFQSAISRQSDRPKVIVYANRKGGNIPPFPGQTEPLVPVHKLPKKQMTSEQSRDWLRHWLDSFATPLLSDDGLLSRSAGRVSRSSCSVTQAERISPIPRPNLISGPAHGGRSNTCVEMFIKEIARSEPDALILSPDEASSNTVDRHGLEIREFLSEQVTFAWAVGAATAGRTSLWISYEAFAPLITTMVTQYARHLSLCPPESQPRRLPCIVLTSLSFRNVASHQDVGFCTDIERRCSAGIVILVPHTLQFTVEAARIATEHLKSHRAIPIVVLDKYPTGPDESPNCLSSFAPTKGWVVYEFGNASHTDGARVAILAFGAVQYQEAVRAARSIVSMGAAVKCDVFVLWSVTAAEDLTATVTDYLYTYDKVAAVAGMRSLAWDRVIERVHASGRLAHSAAFEPTLGPNDVARLFERNLDWLAIVISMSEALDQADAKKEAISARNQLRDEIRRTRAVQWYHDTGWSALVERVGLQRHSTMV